MGYAVRNDGLGWRAVEGAHDCNENETFSEAEPAPVSVSLTKTKFTSLEFLDRFTEEEQLAVVQATMTSAPVKLWYDRLLAASFVDLEDPRTEAGVDSLIDNELIDASRKAEILRPPQLN